MRSSIAVTIDPVIRAKLLRVRTLASTGATVDELAGKTGLDELFIEEKLKSWGITPKRSKPKPVLQSTAKSRVVKMYESSELRSSMTLDKMKQIVRMRSTGMSYHDIAEALDLTYNVVWQVCNVPQRRL